jgi:hypothetical protein
MIRRMRTTAGLFSSVAICLALGLAGCGSDGQVAPPTSALGGGDESLAQVASMSGGAPTVPGQNAQGWGPGCPDRVFSVSAPIDGAVGGIVQLSQCVLTVPPGAFEGTKTITMQCNNAAGLQCQLYPEGLQFARPVQLTMRLLGTPLDGLGTTIYWWDPNAGDGAWVDMNGTYDPKLHTVTADLQHFSLYAAARGGRAGW